VKLVPGAAATEREIIEHCRGRVASFKIPRHVAVVDALPMTSSGKIQKVRLRDRARSEWATAGVR
jgi:acyl-CoA synthetase (AMP-forming)/AMP-acid ligase II